MASRIRFQVAILLILGLTACTALNVYTSPSGEPAETCDNLEGMVLADCVSRVTGTSSAIDWFAYSLTCSENEKLKAQEKGGRLIGACFARNPEKIENKKIIAPKKAIVKIPQSMHPKRAE